MAPNGQHLSNDRRRPWMSGTTRRRLVAAGAGAGIGSLFGGILAACGGSAATTPGGSAAPGTQGWDQQKTTLEFYIYFDDAQMQAADAQLLSAWRSAHPNVPAEILPQPGATVEAIQKLTSLLAGGTPPDVLWDLGTARNLSQLQLVQTLDDLVARDKFDLGRFNAKMLDYKGRFEGKLYMIPHGYGGNALGLLYNRRLFQEAGLPEPPDKFANTWTWAQWTDTLVKLTKKTPDGTIGQFGLGGYGYFMDYPIPYGGKWLADDFQKVVCDSAECIQAYTDYFDLVFKAHVTPQQGEAQTLFGGGSLFLKQKAVINTMGGWEGGTYSGEPAKGLDWAFMPFPKAKVATPDMGPVALALVKGGKNREAAWQFLNWLVQDSRLSRFMTRAPAVNADVEPWARETFKTVPNPRVQVLAEGVGLALPGDNILLHSKWTQMNKEVVTPAFDEVWKGTKSVAAALREIKPTLQNIVDQK
jgi:multiple sugar transport system substrate-binding protein